MLILIWAAAVLLALASVAVMTALVAVRLVSDNVKRRREAKRQSLLQILFAWLEGQRDGDETKRILHDNRSVATSLLIEIFELVRGEDQRRLAALADEAKIPRYLRETIEIGKADERKSAAESLVWFPSPETRAILLFALEDRDPEVSLAAASSLAQLGERLPIRLFFERRLGQTVESSRQLEAVLGKVALQQQDDLIELAKDTAIPVRLRAAAIDALGRSGAFTLMEDLSSLAQAPSAVLRAAVCRAFGAFGHPAAEPTIRRCLDDPDWEVRAEAADAAGRIGLVSTAERLAALLEDENWWVRFRSGTALAALGEAGIAILRRMTQAYADGSGRMAALILAERGLA